ncbi:peptide chain release factor 2 [Acidithiobacillus sp. CV18-2]|uniref:Peptide chain release factor 2 n=1 Tax=Igneacidithiobacillus copahuensis TaxID=2724909 RepID=A0AAE3CJP8_9PROT|nr:peptide chain release factor 2 [Igneacidithiobacillus copahuensis]MBU2755065.1 peptide chain release factor 2 [Acidithiobacillus sp. CV18-3]MBU2756626.1 peptide chain release factor 2 [Acidithiobacillus sp. BN09-2]MBU2777655.1 peptide chain release factor 2 [Acidithiobacillus sp. CV18-2]MBU2796564.1 peptide chain release factor 2 [Acidithiobacillus sp. VAN18-2]MBU2800650.1 peptide chain release factor 2 [Acidithiobacillus sp. VAN18-4]UTV81243.1 peptide chain release factor 2 [Acidithiobaci
MREVNEMRALRDDLQARLDGLRGYLDLEEKRGRLEEVGRELEDPAIWNQPEKAQELGRERASLEAIVRPMDELATKVADSAEMLELALGENDAELLAAVDADLDQALAAVEKLEFQRMFSGPHDAADCFVDIQAGAGGTEAQDWAEMILRMYLRWAEAHGFAAELVEVSEGEVAGIKSASIHVKGDHAFGWLRTETGVHRLVRKSPFDSGNRRHTSFASIFIYPEIDDSFEIDINPADLKTDTYRASGAGGQHINKTDSAVRITHVPTGIVVACQTDRSQHKNRAEAMRMLRSKLYEMELKKREAEKQALEESKSDIGWGHQIRSYVLDQSRIKDLRTSVEVGDTQKVLDGGLDIFIEAALKAGL